MKIGHIETYTEGFWIFRRTHYCVCYGNQSSAGGDVGLTIGFKRHDEAIAFGVLLNYLEEIKNLLKKRNKK